MNEPVVVLTGKAGGKVGLTRGPDRDWRQQRVLVHFPGHQFPNDFRSIHKGNLRAALPHEIARMVTP